MFTLRETLAASLLGIQISNPEVDTVNGIKKSNSKKKAHKKKPKKKKLDARDREEEEEEFESIVDGQSVQVDSEDDEEVVPGAALTLSHVASTQAAAAKKASVLAYQYESTQIGKPTTLFRVECNYCWCFVTFLPI